MSSYCFYYAAFFILPCSAHREEYLGQNVRFENMKILVIYLPFGPIYENDGAVLMRRINVDSKKPSCSNT